MCDVKEPTLLFEKSRGRRPRWCGQPLRVVGLGRDGTSHGPVTPKLKVSEVSQSGFWNISSHPTSVPSFSQISWPQLLAPGTLSHQMTLNPTVTPLIHASIRTTRYTSNPDITLFLIRSCKSTTFQRSFFLTESVECGMLFKFFSSCPSRLLQSSSCRFLHTWWPSLFQIYMLDL